MNHRFCEPWSKAKTQPACDTVGPRYPLNVLEARYPIERRSPMAFPCRFRSALSCCIQWPTMPEKVAKISAAALREVEAALKAYVDEEIEADLSDSRKDVYAYHSTNFVRWLTGDFMPGSRGRF